MVISLFSKNREKEILRYPRLDTVLMVEEFIEENSGEYKKRSLWEHLPKKMMYQTFCVIFDYLIHSHKIALDREGTIAWVWNPELVEKYMNRPDLSWKQEKSLHDSSELYKSKDLIKK